MLSSMDELIAEDEEDMEREALMWRSVTDQSSGKTYYYHVVSRESVWDKPLALCSARERAEVAWRGEQQRSFFAEMEDNIRRKIQQGLLFADVPGGTPPMPAARPQGDSILPSTAGRESFDAGNPLKRPTADRFCRTISTIDDKAVAELNAALNSPRKGDHRGLSSPKLDDDDDDDDDDDMDNDNDYAPSSLHLDGSGSPPGLAPLAPAWTTSCPAVLRRLEGDGRRVIPETVSLRPGRNGSGGGCKKDGTAGREDWSPCQAHHRSLRRDHFSGGSGSVGGVLSSAAGELAGRGKLGVEPVGSGDRKGGGGGRGRGGGGGGRGGAFSPPPQLVRRNSTSTIYLGPHDTLSDPDLDATIRCVCAVLRAHMIEAVADTREPGEESRRTPGGRGGETTRRRTEEEAPVAATRVAPRGGGGCGSASDDTDEDDDDVWGGGGGGGVGERGLAWGGASRESWPSEDIAIFDDAPPPPSSPATAGGEDGAGAGANVGSGAGGVGDGGEGTAVVPSLREITAYYRDLYHRTQLKFDCVVLSLIYVERLMKETKGALRPQPSNWKSLIMSALVLSSKVWDDHSMWNRDFSELCPSFTLVRLNQLELAVLEVLRFNVKVLSSEYAKYYFHLRSMCVRGGLSEDHAPIHPLDMEDVRVLEDLSSKLAIVSVGKRIRTAKAMSLHSVADVKVLQKAATSGYAFTDKHAVPASLEQVVHNTHSASKVADPFY